MTLAGAAATRCGQLFWPGAERYSDKRSSSRAERLPVEPSNPFTQVEPRTNAPSLCNWQRLQIQIGDNPPPEPIAFRQDVAVSILTACGVLSGLVQRAHGSTLRKARRQFLHGNIASIPGGVAAELGMPDLRLSFDGLFASDLSGRARAFQSIVGGGIDIDKAATLAGLLVSGYIVLTLSRFRPFRVAFRFKQSSRYDGPLSN